MSLNTSQIHQDFRSVYIDFGIFVYIYQIYPYLPSQPLIHGFHCILSTLQSTVLFHFLLTVHPVYLSNLPFFTTYLSTHQPVINKHLSVYLSINLSIYLFIHKLLPLYLYNSVLSFFFYILLCLSRRRMPNYYKRLQLLSSLTSSSSSSTYSFFIFFPF